MVIHNNDNYLNVHATSNNSIIHTGNLGKESTKTNQVKGNSVFAGNVNIMKQDTIAMKQAAAQKEALKTILDTFISNSEVDSNMEFRQQHIKQLEAEAGIAQKEIAKADALSQQLMEDYKIEEGSQEQQDFELLAKKQDALKSGDIQLKSLTEAEKDRLTEMGPITDYQKEALNLHEMKSTWQERSDKALKGAEQELGAISSMKQASLKTAPMVSSKKIENEILKNISKEIADILISEGKDHVDDVTEEQQEEIEKQQEKKEEEEKLTEKDNDNQVDNKTQNTVQQADNEQLKLEREIKDLMQKMSTEDLKGLAVDTSL